ncbi:MAG: hypothetical protein RL266_929 [Bacteroidota bacterium]
MRFSLKLFFVSLVFIGHYQLSSAQTTSKVGRAASAKTATIINWIEPITEIKYDGSKRTYLMFEGAVYIDDTNLPHLVKNVKISSGMTLDATLVDARYVPLSDAESAALAGINNIGSSIFIAVDTYTERKQAYARIKFLPIRKNPSNGALEKLVQYELRTSETYLASRKAIGASQFAQSSVLASGTWFKVAVAQDGLYKITYDDLEAMGMNVDAIDPRRLNVYGNGGGMLPQANSAFRFDDLQQNAIEVVGEGDGRFNQGDYILFYAKGPHSWVQDSSSCGLFRHEFDVYSDRAYYYVTADRGVGRRVSETASTNAPATHTVSTFVDHQFHESDNSNLLKSGREWFGEEFDIQSSYSFDFGFSNVANQTGVLKSRVLAQSFSGGTTFSLRINGTTVESVVVPQVSGGYNKNAEDEFTCTPVQFGSGNTNVTLTYNKGGNLSAVGWLDYLEIILTRNLSMAGTQMPFRDLESVGLGNVAEFQLTNANSSVRIWEVTDPTNVTQRELVRQGNTASFKFEADSLRQFIAFNGGSYYGVEPIGPVSNQNLHGLSQANMIMICHPNFLSEAERLANFHEQSEASPLSVHIVTPEQIYNEFSSGAQDVSAIRDFMRMFYQRSTGWQDMPRYLLLFGDASYDYKDRLADNTNFVPTYESDESLTPTISYASDDYFGLLDPSEGVWASSASDALDVGIGRFVVRTLEDARVVVDKIYRYEELDIADLDLSGHNCADGLSAVTSPDWRNRIVFVADDEDSNMHLNQADQLAVLVDTMYPEYNLTKIYFDSFVQESTPGGQRYPEASTSLNTEVQRGALMVNYTGHGGELGWAHERVLGNSDINSWTNFSNLPVFVTATCEFTRYDDPSRISAGELVHLNPNGGGIALFTTSRLVYSAPNFTLNRNFYLNLLVEQTWGPPTMGDVIRMTKVASGGSVNNRNFILIGDPAQRLAFPLHNVETLTINGENVNALTDTINALQLVTVTGRIRNRNGQLMEDFSGTVYPTVFDKASEVSTLGNDPSSSVRQFSVQKNLIYKGKASVEAGQFSFSFVVPRDISYNYDFGRISYYAEGSGTNANGYYEEFVIGGSSDNAAVDELGPTVGLYMNDDSFAFGGTTDENPSLLAIVTDSNGINTVGNGIGHDITAVLDDNTNSTINLNEFYQSDLNSYQSGKVVYPFSGLSEGTHNIRFKIWDVYNNSSEAYTEFVVAESAELALEHVLNYPNPFTTHTEFMFEHNQPCNSLDVQVQIFTVSGKLVKTINETILSHGFRNEPIAWDGLDDYGQKIGRGVYMYNLKVTTPDGQKAEQIERLVILN